MAAPPDFPECAEGCTSLWRGVLLQAFRDVFCEPSGKVDFGSGLNVSATRNWFSKPNDDFDQVCSLADLDTGFVRDRFHRLYRGDEIIELGQMQLGDNKYAQRKRGNVRAEL